MGERAARGSHMVDVDVDMHGDTHVDMHGNTHVDVHGNMDVHGDTDVDMHRTPTQDKNWGVSVGSLCSLSTPCLLEPPRFEMDSYIPFHRKTWRLGLARTGRPMRWERERGPDPGTGGGSAWGDTRPAKNSDGPPQKCLPIRTGYSHPPT